MDTSKKLGHNTRQTKKLGQNTAKGKNVDKGSRTNE
jgi:hypothetical protein